MSVNKALTDSKESINISLRALQALSSGRQSSTLPPILPGLPESFAQLLSQLRYAITSLSLSFKPPITAPAAIAQLDKVNDHYGRIAACVVAVTGGQTGSVLAEEWKEGVESIGSETLRLLDVFVDATQDEKAGKASSNGASGSKDENPYLVHTGLVWDVIDRLAKDLSATEVQAVGKRWRAQVEVMKDAWSEFKEFLEDQAEDEDDLAEDEGADGEDDFGMDDEFGDLEDMMKGGRMAPEERARAEAAKPLFGLYQILQSTIPRYLSLLVLDPEEQYTTLLESNRNLTAAFDTAIAAMYPSQDVDEIEESIAGLSDKSRLLVRNLLERVDRSRADDERRDALRTFLGKWEDRAKKEEQEWKEKGLSVKSLAHALP